MLSSPTVSDDAKRSDAWAGFDPVPLASAPEVNDFLIRLGVGRFAEDSVRAPAGRNDVWVGDTQSGQGVFVKRLEGLDAARRLDRILAFESIVRGLPAEHLRIPRLLGTDYEYMLVAHERVDGETVGTDAEDLFTLELCEQAGRAIAALHALPGGETLDESEHPMPPVEHLAALPLAMLENISAGGLEVWGMMQSDAGLAPLLARLRADSMAHREAACHADLRLDQFIIGGDALYLSDFEETRWSDPARDIGAFVGDWVHHAVLGIPEVTSSATAFGEAVSHEQVVAAGAERLDQLRPRIAGFWNAYLGQACPGDPGGLAARSAAFAGWHLFDRAIAAASRASRVPVVSRAAAGIGRTILADPEAAASALALETAR
jgi:hypothetical protein